MASESADDEYGNPGQGGGGTGTSGNASVTGSAAAKKYFASFPADEQARIVASTGGNLDQWFQNAVAAGAVQPSGDRNPGEQTSDTSGTGGGWTPARIRQHFQSQGFDTFDNIDDNTLWTWINQGLWDPAAKRFKPERQSTDGREIDYSRQPDFKPSDCPEGYTPTGSGSAAKCAPNTDFDPNTGAYTRGAGGTGAAAATPAAAPASTAVVDPLQAALVAAFQGREGAFTRSTAAGAELGDGGIFWTDPTAQRAATGGLAPQEGKQSGGSSGNCPPGTFPKVSPCFNPPCPTECVPAGSGQPGIGSSALTAATLNAFTPAAPSQTAAATPQVSSGSAWSGGALPANPAPSSITPAPWVTSKPPDPLTGAVSSAYTRRKPQDWWRAQPGGQA
jgi:hypothetical protein